MLKWKLDTNHHINMLQNNTLNYEIVNSYPHLTITTANKLLLLFYNYNISFTWSIPLTDSSPMKKTWGSSFPFVNHEIDKRN